MVFGDGKDKMVLDLLKYILMESPFKRAVLFLTLKIKAFLIPLFVYSNLISEEENLRGYISPITDTLYPSTFNDKVKVEEVN